jgi:hypothetical protein
MSVNYETVPSPNYAAYANPGFGAALGQMLQGLPDQYMKGRENSRKIEAEDAFRNGYPKNEDGSPNVNKIMDIGLKTGGLPYAQGLMEWLKTNDLLRNTKGDLSDGGPQEGAPPARPAPVSGAAGPSGLGAPPQPQLSSAGTDSKGDQTINSLASEVFGDRDMTAALPRYAAAVGNKLGEPLTADQEQRARVLMQRSKGAMASASPGDTAATPGGGGSGPQNSANAAPFMAGGASRAPAAAPAQGNSAPPAQMAQAQSGAGTGLPAGFDQATSQRLHAAAAAIMEKGKSLAILKNPELSKAYQERASQLEARANKIDEALADNAKFTGEQKNARDPSVQAQKTEDEVRKGDIARGEKTFTGLEEAGIAGRTGNQKLDVMRTQMSDPNFFSGAGNELVKKFQQWSVSLGGNPRAAEPMEEFHKTALDLLNEQIRSLAAGGVSRIQLQEIRNLKESIASLGISPASNRYLTEELYRVHNNNIQIADLARQYRSQHQYLDAGWEGVRDKFLAQHPLFSKEEIADPRLISPPYLPRAIASDPARHATWLRQQGIKPGDPIKTDDPKRPIVWAK